MANTGHYRGGQRSGTAPRQSRSAMDYYIDGNTVRKTQTMPGPAQRQPRPHSTNTAASRRPAERRADHRTARSTAQRQPVRPSVSQPARKQTQHQPVRKTAVQTTKRQSAVSEKQRRVNQRIAMRNREKALKIDWKYTLFLCTAVLIVLGSCVMYLSAQTKITQKTSNIAALRSELNTLTDANVAARERINEAVDLEYVREYATEKLDMVYPTQDQIVKYQSSTEDYVKQHQDIPQSGD